MLASIQSFLGWKEVPAPPPTTVKGVRIPADGTPPHVVSLTTIPASGATDDFLFHVPDLRRYWNAERAWTYRDLDKLILLQPHHIQQWHRSQQNMDPDNVLHHPDLLYRQRQRQLQDQSCHVLRQQHSSCAGAYYLFYSFAIDDLPENTHVPAWMREGRGRCLGDVFLVKLAPQEFGEHGWATYEDIVPQFLDLMKEGPYVG
ncbi:hypothetical protein BDV96DRAFT_565904 [Lophiotrema nucula]|uniref:Uncharacterized protein n=1 Tax=Lophiotrema nucula TaxID=690887 RepID=A0A6A5ZP07_9PLEO|nr:hypothetical protein BDV96DRAFT_565904 [Lophiotrema nucula]